MAKWLTSFLIDLKQRGGPGRLLVIAGGFVIVALADVLSGPLVSMSIFYLIPILFGCWVYGGRMGLFLSFLAMIAWVVIEYFTSEIATPLPILLWNGFVRLGFFSTIAYFFSRLSLMQDHQARLLDERTDMLQVALCQRELLERELLDASHRTQKRIAEDLHDGVGQYLVGLAFRAKNLADSLPAEAPSKKDAEQLSFYVLEGVRQVRNVSRGLTPIEFEGVGFSAAVQRLVRSITESTNIPVDYTPAEDVELAFPCDIYMFRILQEALSNAVRHSEASQIKIEFARDETGVSLSVHDNGQGFDVQNVTYGLGQKIMAQRAERVGGKFQIFSTPGKGTFIYVWMPNESNEKRAPYSIEDQNLCSR
jgi:signal transduction histidine kinase